MERQKPRSRDAGNTIPDSAREKAARYVEQSHEKFMRLEQSMRIDKTDLDTMLIEQPQLYYDVAYDLAWHISFRDGMKQELDELEAKLDAKFRHDAAVAEERITETEIKRNIATDSDVQEMRRKLWKQNQVVGRWDALKQAYTQRSYVLKDLVALYIAQYYGDSASGAGHRGMRDVKAERGRTALRDSYREQQERK